MVLKFVQWASTYMSIFYDILWKYLLFYATFGQFQLRTMQAKWRQCPLYLSVRAKPKSFSSFGATQRKPFFGLLRDHKLNLDVCVKVHKFKSQAICRYVNNIRFSFNLIFKSSAHQKNRFTRFTFFSREEHTSSSWTFDWRF